MDDLISRQDAIDALGNGALVNYEAAGHHNGLVKAIDVIKGLPSAPKDICDRKAGEWDMFELITSVYHGKQYYFKEEYELVYSRASHKTMTFDDALREFLSEVGE